MTPPSASVSSGEESSGAENGSGSVLHEEAKVAWRSSRNLGASLIITWTVTLLVRFALPRQLGPAAFGDLNYANAFAEGFLLFATLGLDTYTMREIAVRPKHASDYFGGSVAVRALLWLFLFTLMAVVLHVREKALDLRATVFVFGVNWALAAVTATLATMLQATGHSGRLALTNVLGKIVWGAGIAAALWLPGQGVALWVFAVPTALSEALRLALTFWAVRSTLQLKLRIDVAATRGVLWTSFPFFLSALATSLGGPLNMSVLDVVAHDKRELGWYGAMLNLSSLAMIFSPLLTWVLLPLLSRARARSQAEVGVIIGYALEAFTMGVLPIVLIGWLGAELWIELTFGPAYLAAIVSFRIVVILIVVTYCAMILSMGLVASNYSWSLSSLSLVPLLGAPLLASLLVPWFGNALGVGGQAAGASVALAVPECVVVALSLARMDHGARTPRLLRNVGKAVASCLLVVALDRALLSLGQARLILDLLAYAALLLASRAVSIGELRALFLIAQEARRGR